MPRFEVTVFVEVPEGTQKLDEIEELVDRAVRRAGCELIERVIPTIEPSVLEEGGGARQRPAARYVLTRFGEIRYSRYKVLLDGRYIHPLDRALGLSTHQTISPALFSDLVWLAQVMPYRQAADAATRLLGHTIDHRRLWRAAQKAGGKLRDDVEAKRAALFEWGEAPPPGGPHRMVVVEADGTGLRIREPVSGVVRTQTTEVKLAIWYAGKRVRRSGQGRRRRRAFLVRKGAYATTQDADAFAQAAFVTCEEAVGLSRARHRLGISDGGGWLPRIFAEWLRVDAHQLDHFHGRRRCTTTPGLPRHIGERLWEHTLDGRLDRVAASLRARVVAASLDEDEAHNLLDYLRGNQPRLHAAAELKKQGAPPELCVRGSGAIEHNVDLVIARRMKRRGMFWSREGADNMLALRCAALDPDRWKEAMSKAA